MTEILNLFNHRDGAVGVVDKCTTHYIFSKPSYSENTYFEIGSLTKLFTAALILRAIEHNLLSLSDPLSDFFCLPRRKTYPTIEDLLSHYSGYQKDYFELLPVLKCAFGINNSISLSRHDLYLRLLKETNKDIGHYRYSNFGYAVLGNILEKVHKRTYLDLLSEYLRVEQMSNTGVNVCNHDGFWKWNNRNSLLAAGGLTSTISDMLAFATNILAHGSEYLPIKVLRSVSLNGKDDDVIGIGMSWKIRNNGKAYHTGCTENFNSYISVDPNNKTAVVVLLNAPFSKEFSALDLGKTIELQL